MFSTTPLNREKNKVTEAIRRTKKKLFYESFRENRDDSKKIWFALKDLTGQKNHGGVSYLEENRSTPGGVLPNMGYIGMCRPKG